MFDGPLGLFSWNIVQIHQCSSPSLLLTNHAPLKRCIWRGGSKYGLLSLMGGCPGIAFPSKIHSIRVHSVICPPDRVLLSSKGFFGYGHIFIWSLEGGGRAFFFHNGFCYTFPGLCVLWKFVFSQGENGTGSIFRMCSQMFIDFEGASIINIGRKRFKFVHFVGDLIRRGPSSLV